MWRLNVGSNDNNNPLLRSLSGFAGRLTWTFDENAGSQAERQFVEDAREKFSRSRHEKQHSSDVLYRTQFGGTEPKVRKPASPAFLHLQTGYMIELLKSQYTYAFVDLPVTNIWMQD